MEELKMFLRSVEELKRMNIVLCKNIKCKHNLRPVGIMGCNLKSITINSEGTCSNSEAREVKECL